MCLCVRSSVCVYVFMHVRVWHALVCGQEGGGKRPNESVFRDGGSAGKGIATM